MLNDFDVTVKYRVYKIELDCMYCGDVSTQVNPRNMYNFINIVHKILLYTCPKLNIPIFINWEKKNNSC